MSQAAFDPCRQWLGIDAVELADPRRVLGLSPAESDPLAVLRAAEGRLAVLRGVSAGPFEIARTALIERVKEAREAVLVQIAAAPAVAAPASFSMPPPPGGGAAAARSAGMPAVPPFAMPPVPPPVPSPATLPGTGFVPPAVPGGGASGWQSGSGWEGAAGGLDGLEGLRARTVSYRRKSTVPVGFLVLIGGLCIAAAALGLNVWQSRLASNRKASNASRLANDSVDGRQQPRETVAEEVDKEKEEERPVVRPMATAGKDGNTTEEMPDEPAASQAPSGGTVSGGTVSGGTVSGGTVSGGTVSGGTVSGEEMPGGQVAGEPPSGRTETDGQMAAIPAIPPEKPGTVEPSPVSAAEQPMPEASAPAAGDRPVAVMADAPAENPARPGPPAAEAAMPAATPTPFPPAKPREADPVPNPDRDRRRVDAAIAAAFAAMQRQEFDTVGRELAAAKKAAADAAAGERVARWEQLAHYSKEFQTYLDKALADVESGHEYDVNGKKVAIVEIDDEKLIFRSKGRNKTVDRDKIPQAIVMAIVEGWFAGAPVAANDLFLGAHHFTKPEPDATKARMHWERARAGGADASQLLPLLQDPAFRETAFPD